MKKTILSVLIVFLLLSIVMACTREPKEAIASEAQRHVLTGVYEEQGTWESLTDAAFLLVLETDGSARLDRYAFAYYDTSPAVDNPSYTAAYGVGTWKSVIKDERELLQIKLALANGASQTIYAEKDNGKFAFDLSFPIQIGAGADMRICRLTETATAIANADDFIGQFSRTFTEPASIARMEDAASNGKLLFFEDGAFTLMHDFDTILTGQWGKNDEGVTLTIGAEKYELPIEDGALRFDYSYTLQGVANYDFVLTMADASLLPARSRMIFASGERDYSTVPDPLLFMDGSAVQTEDDFAKRRDEVLTLFSEYVYGPIPTDGYSCTFTVVEEGDALNGAAYRRQIRMLITTDLDDLETYILMYTPKAASNTPVIVGLNYSGNHIVLAEPAIMPSRYSTLSGDAMEASRGKDTSSIPVETAIANGYAVCTLCYNDISVDSRERYREDLIALFDEQNMGSLSAWAFAMSRYVDYLETVETIDPDRIVFVGHSRLGKAATWAAASDQRVAMVISNCSGSAGSSMTRGNQGETLTDVTTFFPYWLSPAYASFSGRENELPVDQNLLLACMADRYLCVGSAESDGTADPRGAWNALCFAEDAFLFFNDAPLDTSFFDNTPFASPVVLETDRIHYHLREGSHSLSDVDWNLYFVFMNRVFGMAE